jgi:hypothetical protein
MSAGPSGRVITLEDWEYEWASHVAMRRMISRFGSQDSPQYDNDKKQPELLATVATCCCEMAVAKALNRYWSGHFWDARDHGKFKDIADVGENIEVRRVREKFNPMWIDPKDVKAGRTMVAAYPEPPEYRRIIVWGYISAADGWERAELADPRSGRRKLDLAYLKSLPEAKNA